MFHRTWGLMFLRENVSAPCTLLDFPTRERFVKELLAPGLRRRRHLGDRRQRRQGARRCAGWCGEHSPRSTIVVGGHVTSIPDIERRIDADHIVRGEGIAWLRTVPRRGSRRADPPSADPVVVRHAGDGAAARRERAAAGPRRSCRRSAARWAATSARRRRSSAARDSSSTSTTRGEELFEVMCDAERRLGTQSFFMMDENFLLHKRRALELLELHARARQGLVALRLLVRERHPPVRHPPARRARRRVDLARSRSRRSNDYVKLAGTDTLALTRDAAGARHLRARLDDRRHGASHAGEHLAGPRSRHRARHRVPPVHALHADARHAAPPRGAGRGSPARRRGPRRHPRAVRLQLPSSGDFARSSPRSCSTRRSGPTTSGTARASTG